MKNLLFLILTIFLLLFAFSSCDNSEQPGENENPSEETVDESDDICEHILTESVYKPAKPGINGIMYISCNNCDFSELKEIPALPAAFELTVTNKSTAEYENEQYICFDIQIKNISEQTIESISGSLHAVGSKILIISCNFDNLNLAVGETKILNQYGVKVDNSSQFAAVSKYIYDTPFEDLKFLFEATDIIISNQQ